MHLYFASAGIDDHHDEGAGAEIPILLLVDLGVSVRGRDHFEGNVRGARKEVVVFDGPLAPDVSDVGLENRLSGVGCLGLSAIAVLERAFASNDRARASTGRGRAFLGRACAFIRRARASRGPRANLDPIVRSRPGNAHSRPRERALASAGSRTRV